MADFTGTTDYPADIDAFDVTKDNANPIGQDLVDVRAAVVAIQTELGINPSASEDTVDERIGALVGGASFPLDNTGATAGTDALTLDVTGDSVTRFVVNHDGKLEWGSGSGAVDTNLYRSAADTLKTDDNFYVGAYITMTAGNGVTEIGGHIVAGQNLIMRGDGFRIQWEHANNQQTTVGAAGGASALPATPTKYMKIQDSAGTTLVIPAYAAS
jgi:hypothetical protein